MKDVRKSKKQQATARQSVTKVGEVENGKCIVIVIVMFIAHIRERKIIKYI